MRAVAHPGEKEAAGTGRRCERWQQRESVIAAVSFRSGSEGVMHQDGAAVGELGARAIEHCLRLVSAPVVRVDRPAHELQAEPLCYTPARIGTDAPRHPPKPRMHPDPLQCRECRFAVVLQLSFSELGVANVAVTVELYVVSRSAHPMRDIGIGEHSLADHEERRRCLAAMELLHDPRRPGRVGSVIKG